MNWASFVELNAFAQKMMQLLTLRPHINNQTNQLGNENFAY